MIRPFDLRDFPLVKRLEANIVVLDSRKAFTEGCRPSRDALLAYLLGSRGTPTFVMRRRSSDKIMSAFGQLKVSPSDRARSCQRQDERFIARVVTLATDPPGSEIVTWPFMLDALTSLAGYQGVRAILAEVEETESNFQLLRRSDFVVFARQEIWRLDVPCERGSQRFLRQKTASDEPRLYQLVASTCPQYIPVEPTTDLSTGLIGELDGKIVAFFSVHQGPRGIWIRPFIDPSGERLACEMIFEAISLVKPSSRVPLFFCIRRHQIWLNQTLIDLGFCVTSRQAVMVRHIALRSTQPHAELVALREKALEATSPVVQSTQKN